MRSEIEADYRAAAGDVVAAVAIVWQLWQEQQLPEQLLSTALLMEIVKHAEGYAAQQLQGRAQQPAPEPVAPPIAPPEEAVLSSQQLQELQAAAMERIQQADRWLQNRERGDGGAPW